MICCRINLEFKILSLRSKLLVIKTLNITRHLFTLKYISDSNSRNQMWMRLSNIGTKYLLVRI